MGKILEQYQASTEKVENAYHASDFAKSVETVSTTAKDIYNVGSSSVILALSKAWIGIGMVNPAKTDKSDKLLNTPEWLKKKQSNSMQPIKSQTREVNRFNYSELYYLQLGKYYMPLSQTFTLAARKRTNISSLVDGIDIIQQTRKEAKTIDCTLRIGLRDYNDNIKIVTRDGEDFATESGEVVQAETKIAELSSFLRELYESDVVFEINNDTINNTHGVTHVFMTDYKFTPRTGMGTYTLEFSLMEVVYGENVLTFNLKQIGADNNGQIGG